MKDILVTGGFGFIGSNLVDELSQRFPESQIAVVDDGSTGKIRYNPESHPNVQEYVRDIRDLKSLDFGSLEFSHVFHLAAQVNVRVSKTDPKLDAEINYLGTLELLEKIRPYMPNVNLVFASSGGAMYSHPMPDLGYAEFPQTPNMPYGIAKSAAEKAIAYYGEEHGLRYTNLRLANVYGPRRGLSTECGVIGLIYQNILKNELTKINNLGESSRDFVYVGDVIEAMLLAAEKPQQQSINIGTGIATTVKEVLNLFGEHFPGFAYGPNPNPVKEIKDSKLDARLAQATLGWAPRTMLYDGVRKLIESEAQK